MPFEPNALPTLIWSLPLAEHAEATQMALVYVPEIPIWVQLPSVPEERLLSQFAEGLPGIRGQGETLFFDTISPAFEDELLSFFEQYLAVTEGGAPLAGSIFAFSEKTGRGFRTFLDAISGLASPPFALKGQITGPFTLLTGLKDQAGRLAYFDSQLREAVAKALALKARYQIEERRRLNPTAICFLDEPALAGFGSSGMVGIAPQDVVADLSEVIDGIHAAGGLAGVHVCANTDWSLVLSTHLDILSFDAYGFFDRLVLFRNEITKFLERGKVIAWGLVPTLISEDLEREDVKSLFARWHNQVGQLGIPLDVARRQALITPSCGTGLLSLEFSRRALALTRDLSQAIRKG